MLEYNPIPTDKRQFDSGVQMTRKRKRNKKHKNVFLEIKNLNKGGTKNVWPWFKEKNDQGWSNTTF